MKKNLSLNLACGLMLMASMGAVRGTIPASAISDPRYALGYLVVTNYAGVDPSGTTDSTVGIQNALDDAPENKLVVFFPPGTYQITNTLRCYNYALWSVSAGHADNPNNDSGKIVGSKLGASRPLIKLKASAPLFSSANSVRPMIAFREWRAVNSGGVSPVLPANAFLTDFGDFEEDAPDLFDSMLRNIDFDCNGNAGAVGVSFNGAQNCSMDNVRVVATGAYAGFFGAPAGVGGVGNLEVQGGRYGIIMGRVPSTNFPSSAGTGDSACFPGIRLVDQTVSSLVVGNFNGPVEFVGFYIKPAAGATVIQNVPNPSFQQSTVGTFGFLDGTIDMANNSGAVAITNTDVKTMHVYNVYVTNTDNLIKSGSEATVTGTGAWKLIKEYVYTDQRAPAGDPPYETNDFVFRTYSIINGTVSRTPVEPVKTIQNSVSAPPIDLLSRHVWSDLPSFEDGTITDATHGLGTFINPLDYGATADTAFTNNKTGPNDSIGLQAAIDAATTAGHGRVILPRGDFYITNTLTLNANTKFFGAASRVANLYAHDTWKPTNGTPIMLQTVDDASATTILGWMTITAKTYGGKKQADGAFPYDRFTHVLWRAGRESMSISWTAFVEDNFTNTPSNPRSIMYFSGNGGGRHYGFSSPGRRMDGTGTRVLVFNRTKEPTWFYTCNVEVSKAGSGIRADSNIAMTNSANIRLIGMKREGRSPTIIMDTCTNIALYGHEDRTGITNEIVILGQTTNVVVAGAFARKLETGFTNGVHKVLHEAITGQPVVDFAYPEAISIYQRGALNESAVYIGGGGGSAPAAPSGLTATVVGPNQIDLDWVDNASDETGFRVKRSGTHLGPYSQVDVDQAAIGGTGGAGSYSDTTVSPSSTYYYVVSAFNGSGENTSSEVSGTTPAGVPAAPTGLNATTLSYNQISLTWTDNANNETGFRLERKKGSGGTYAQIASLPANATSYGDSNNTGVATQYYYRIAATNAVGSSTFSTEDDATTSEITSGRVGHWALDEGSGTTTTDASGNGNLGTLGTSPNTPVWTTTGKIGNALRFDGANDEVNVGHGTSLQLTSSTTWLGWIYLSNTVTTARDIISKRGGSTARGWSFYVEDSRLKIQVCDSANQANNVIRSNTTALASAQWYHVAGVYNATAQTLDVYINGSVNNGNLTLTGLAGVPAAQFDAPANDVYLGRKNAASEWWNGMLDEVRVYNRALTVSEIGACYNAGLP